MGVGVYLMETSMEKAVLGGPGARKSWNWWEQHEQRLGVVTGCYIQRRDEIV